jgi:hypothetical protein
VLDHSDPIWAHAIDAGKDVAASVGHDDEFRGASRKAHKHTPLTLVGLGENCVQGNDDWRADMIEQGKDVLASVSAEYPEFVLETNELNAGRLYTTRRFDIGAAILLGDFEVDFARIGPRPSIRHRIYIARKLGIGADERAAKVCRKRRYAASSRRVVADERDAPGAKGSAPERSMFIQHLKSCHNGSLLVRGSITVAANAITCA